MSLALFVSLHCFALPSRIRSKQAVLLCSAAHSLCSLFLLPPTFFITLELPALIQPLLKPLIAQLLNAERYLKGFPALSWSSLYQKPPPNLFFSSSVKVFWLPWVGSWCAEDSLSRGSAKASLPGLFHHKVRYLSRHRITEWSGLEGTSEGPLVQPRAKAGSPTAGCTGPCPGRFYLLCLFPILTNGILVQTRGFQALQKHR